MMNMLIADMTYTYFNRKIGMQIKAQKIKFPAITSSFMIPVKGVMTGTIEG